MELKPSPLMERTLKVINECLGFAGVPYWLSFGGLFALVRNDGIIPDGDFDICTYYGADWKRIVRAFAGFGMKMSKGVIDDTTGNMLYCGFNYEGDARKFTHICLSFWIKKRGMRWYCHDQNGDLKDGEIGVPKSGYFFKGVPADIVADDRAFKFVEWPGICGRTKVRVPLRAGTLLDTTYIGWAYKWQRYNVYRNQVERDKLHSYYSGGGISPHMVHLDSVADFGDNQKYDAAYREGRRKYNIKLKEIVKKQ